MRGELRPGGDSREWCDVEVLRRLRRASLAALRKEIEPAEQRRLAAFMPSWQGIDRHRGTSIAGATGGLERLREVLVPLQGLALPVEIWERDVLPRRIGSYSQSWMDSLCASGELVWVGAGPGGGQPARRAGSGRVAVYFRDDAAAIGPPGPGGAASARGRGAAPAQPEHELLRARLAAGPAFFTDLLAELDAPAETLRDALWDLVWAGEVTNDAWAPLRAPRLSLAQVGRGAAPRGQTLLAAARPSARRSRFAPRRRAGGGQLQGRWSLTEAVFGVGGEGDGMPARTVERRRTLAELLLERYGIVTREHVLAEGVPGGFAMLYDTFCNLETLGICRRGYFIEGMGGAQFALPGAVERLRAEPGGPAAIAGAQAGERSEIGQRTLVLAAADPSQPYGAALPWPKREGETARAGRPARVAGAYVVLVEDDPVLYVERGGRGLVTLARSPGDRGQDTVRVALAALARAVRAGALGKLALERIDGEPAIASALAGALVELGFHSGPRRLTLSA